MFKVSVIISVYNTSKYLRQCLDCVVNQTLSDIEIICVNDGSTDNSLDILNEYAARDKRIKVISKENEGLGAAPARNLGLTVAQGEYISVLDSDDFFELDMLEKMVQKAEETNADIVLCGGMEYNNLNDNKIKSPSILNKKVIPQKNIFSYKDCPNDIFELSKGYAWNKLYRHCFLDKHKIRFQRIKFTDDAYFTYAHMVLAEKITIVNESFVYYRVNTGTSQSDGLSNYPESAYLPYVELKKSLIDWGIYETVKQSFVNCVTAYLRYFSDKVSKFEAFEFLITEYQNKIFQELDISGCTKDYFYDERVYQWQKLVSENSVGKIAFISARSFGCDMTTAVLRFQIPYHLIPRNSRIVLLGTSLIGIGRYYYSQCLLSLYCNVILWCDIENPKPSINIYDISEIKNTDFDFILIGYAQSNLIESSIKYLNSIGIPNEKIILGGTN